MMQITIYTGTVAGLRNYMSKLSEALGEGTTLTMGDLSIALEQRGMEGTLEQLVLDEMVGKAKALAFVKRSCAQESA